MKNRVKMVCSVLVMHLLFWALHNAVASNPTLPEDVIAALGEPGKYPATERQVTSALQKLGKTLILESTRGAKEVAIYRKTSAAVVLVITDEGFGSGAIIDRMGHVITNWHVVESHPQVVVVFKPKDGTELTKEMAFSATVEKVDQVSDLALLKIDNPPKAFESLRLGDTSTLAVGQDVHAIGHPEGEIWTYTKGIISQIRPNYEWSSGDNLTHRATVIQTQTPINPGNSGGPLLDDKGSLIGINSFRYTRGQGLNYAVAVDVVKSFLKRTGSRKATRRRTRVAKGESECRETYQSDGRTIVGCYVRTSAPPPDAWAVIEGDKLVYAAWGADVLKIDRISVNVNLESKEYYQLIDIDCNGIVDVIGHKYGSKKEIDSYRVPDKPLRLADLAKELDRAFKTRKIPYKNVRICQ